MGNALPALPQPTNNEINFSDVDSYVNSGNFLMLVDSHGTVTSLTQLARKLPEAKVEKPSEEVKDSEAERKRLEVQERLRQQRVNTVAAQEANAQVLSSLNGPIPTPHIQEKGIWNDPRLTHIPKGTDAKHLGTLLYHAPHFDVQNVERGHTLPTSDLTLQPLLPRLSSSELYHTFDVLIPHQALSVGSGYFPTADGNSTTNMSGNLGVRRRCLWGTSIYTDDSDLVAMCIHDGWYWPSDALEPRLKPTRSIPPAIPPASQSSPKADPEAIKQESEESKAPEVKQESPEQHTHEKHLGEALPNPPAKPLHGPKAPHSLLVRVRILPRLLSYASSLRFGIMSRGWSGEHEGESLRIESVRVVEPNESIAVTSKVMIDDKEVIRGAHGWETEQVLVPVNKRMSKKKRVVKSGSQEKEGLHLVMNTRGDALYVQWDGY